MLIIDRLSVALNEQPIIKNISLSVAPGTTHLLMGANGSGKSTLAYTLMGHPRYQITAGTLSWNGKVLNDLSLTERALAGIFMGFQHPLEIPGVSVERFAMQLYQARFGGKDTPTFIQEQLHAALQLVGLPLSFAQRAVNVGFSGGEKKRFELAQMVLLRPSLIILDEIDSGLDAQGLHLINTALQAVRAYSSQVTTLIISHNARISEYIPLDQSHTMQAGFLVLSDSPLPLSSLTQKGMEHGA